MPARPSSRRSRMPRSRRRPQGVSKGTLLASLALCVALLLLLVFAQSLLARVGSAEESAELTSKTGISDCDQLWAQRAPKIEEGLAPAEPSRRAIQTCLSASEDAKSLAFAIAGRWRALRAVHYLSAFTDASEAEKAGALEDAAAIADRTLVALSEMLDGQDLLEGKASQLIQRLEAEGFDSAEIARLHFWTAIVWGAKGQTAGLLQIVRQGVANRMHDNARIAIRLDPRIDRGGAYRLLSRLNAGLPRVPFVSSWVDRDKALPLARKAVGEGPEDPGNKLILALALIDAEGTSRSEIEALLREITEAPARPTLLAEDWAIQKQAREVLAELLLQL